MRVCLAVVLCSWAALGSVFPRWLSVMPLNEDNAEEVARDAADLGNTTFIDGVLWMCAVNPEGNPAVDRAAIYANLYRKTAPLLKAISPVKQGILLQATMGHGGFPGSVTPWQLTVRPDGTSAYRMCPMDSRFLDYVARACRTFSELNPDFFMVDDDTRIVFNEEAPGCFCPLHLAEFARRTGRSWTREEVVELLKKGHSGQADAWMDVKVDSMKRFFQTIRDNFRADIPGSICVVSSRCHLMHAREFAQILAAPGQRPVVRGSGAPYHGGGKNLFHVVDMYSTYARQMELVGKDVIYLQESDTCPHTLWATGAVRTYDHLVMLALTGCKGAKIWITRTGNYGERKSGEAYRRILRENKGLMEWAARTDFTPAGVVVPVCGPKYVNFGDRYLSCVGIPYRFGRAKAGEVTALTEATLNLLTAYELQSILSGRVILDGPAAMWLTRHGYAADIGVTAQPWARKTIQVHEFSNGMHQLGMRTAGLADLTRMGPGAKIVTKLLNRPALGARPKFEAPGSVIFTNARGGRILTLAQPIPSREPVYYEAAMFSEGYKAELLRWFAMLCGGLPGDAVYNGVLSLTCLSGRTADGERVFVLNALDLDGEPEPEMRFAQPPASIERLHGDGTWKTVAFSQASGAAIRLSSPVEPQRPAIFRWK